MVKDYPIEIVRKNTRTLTVTVTDDDGAVVNLTGYTMKMTIKKNATDTDANAVAGPITATVSAPTTGVGSVALTTTHTDLPEREYVYDIKIENAGGTDRHTVVGPSVFSVIQNVTVG